MKPPATTYAESLTAPNISDSPLSPREVLANLAGHEFSTCIYSAPGVGRIDAVVRIGYTTIYQISLEGRPPNRYHYLSGALHWWETHASAPLHNVRKLTAVDQAAARSRREEA